MKNEEIIKSFDAVNITDESKKKILENILTEEKNCYTPFPKTIICSLAALLIFLINISFNSSYSGDTVKGNSRSFQENQVFIYNNRCYKEKRQITRYVSNEKDTYNKVILSLKNYRHDIKFNKNSDYSSYQEVNCQDELKG